MCVLFACCLPAARPLGSPQLIRVRRRDDQTTYTFFSFTYLNYQMELLDVNGYLLKIYPLNRESLRADLMLLFYRRQYRRRYIIWNEQIENNTSASGR